jgi:uncharacterized protein (DUF433 family)
MTPTIINPITETIDLSQYIENRLMSGRPHIKGRRIPIALLFGMAEVWTVAQIVEEFELDEKTVLVALLYAQLHANEMEAFIKEDEALAEEGAKKMPERWQKELNRREQP